MLKRLFRVLMILAVAAVLLFSFSSCEDEDLPADLTSMSDAELAVYMYTQYMAMYNAYVAAGDETTAMYIYVTYIEPLVASMQAAQS